MEPESFYNLLQHPKVAGPPVEEELPQGEKKKYLPPTSRGDPKFEELQKVLMEWINAKLLPEHIVVRSLEEDIFDGLILHHLFQTLTGLKLEVEEMALTAPSQRRKLEVVLEAINGSLQVGEQQLKWSVATIFSKDLLATLHLLVALAKRFQPDLPLPTNVRVEVITMESTKSGLKSEKSVEQLTECSTEKDQLASMTQLPRALAFCTMQAPRPHSANPEMLGRRPLGRVSVRGRPRLSHPRPLRGPVRGAGGGGGCGAGRKEASFPEEEGCWLSGCNGHPPQMGQEPYCAPKCVTCHQMCHGPI
ncbi:gamma-parvin isoform X3 [Vulpes vulpes]|uniref:Gamma-parvin isoform X3 n=1 Tax=Vulpes vulpes TaxID=9627 RepID=A0ABM4Z7P8_VULVU